MMFPAKPSAAVFSGAANQRKRKAAESVGGLALGGSTGTACSGATGFGADALARALWDRSRRL